MNAPDRPRRRHRPPRPCPPATGLLAISLGRSHNFRDDHEQLAHGFVIYDGLYAWCQFVRDEKHWWNPPHPRQRGAGDLAGPPSAAP